MKSCKLRYFNLFEFFDYTRSRTGQGEMPRRARHTLAGRLAAGQPLCASHLPTEAGIRHSGAAGLGSRHRGHDGDVHGDQQRLAEAACLPRAGKTSHFARTHGTVRGILGILDSCFRGREARKPHARPGGVEL